MKPTLAASTLSIGQHAIRHCCTPGGIREEVSEKSASPARSAGIVSAYPSQGFHLKTEIIANVEMWLDIKPLVLAQFSRSARLRTLTCFVGSLQVSAVETLMVCGLWSSEGFFYVDSPGSIAQAAWMMKTGSVRSPSVMRRR